MTNNLQMAEEKLNDLIGQTSGLQIQLFNCETFEFLLSLLDENTSDYKKAIDKAIAETCTSFDVKEVVYIDFNYSFVSPILLVQSLLFKTQGSFYTICDKCFDFTAVITAIAPTKPTKTNSNKTIQFKLAFSTMLGEGRAKEYRTSFFIAEKQVNKTLNVFEKLLTKC